MLRKFTKKTLVFILLIVFVVSFVGCSNGEAAKKEDAKAKTYSWKVGYNTVEGSVRDEAAKEFKRIVEEKSQGNVKIQLFPNEVLGSENEMTESVKTGALDFAITGMGTLTPRVPALYTVGLPFMVNDFDEAHAVMDSAVGDSWKAMAEEHNYKLLSFCDLGFAQITNNVRPINTAKDLKAIKMRCPNDPVPIATFRALDASVSTTPFSEVYIGLSQGVIEGQFNPLDAIYQTKFHEVQKYLAITNHFFYYANLLMNKDLYDGLDPELQKIVMEAAQSAQEVSRKYSKDKQDSMLELLKNEFDEITNPDLDSFRSKLGPAMAEFEKIIPKEEIEKTEKFLQDYRKK